MATGSSGNRLGVTRMRLYEFLSNESLLSRANTVSVRRQMVDFVKSKMPGLREEDVINKISLFSHRLLIRWKESGRNNKSFLKRNEDWLVEEIHLADMQSQQKIFSATPVRHPRTLKKFDSLSTRTKRRRIKNLVARHSPEELAFATQTGFTKQGKRNVAHVIKKATTTSPRSVSALKRSSICKNVIQRYTPEEALALIIDSKLTKSQYTKLRNGAKERNCEIYPPYDEILRAKKECYPKNINVTETMGEVQLQSLLDHTVQRLCTVQNEVISSLVRNQEVITLEMIYKWGFDGSSSHSMYKQKFQESCGSTDSDLLLTSIVPLKMIARNNVSEEIVWMNPRASSTRFCIPIKFQFIKETQDIIKQENEYIEAQISALTPTCISINARDINVQHTLLKTMVDGKVANALAGNPSTQSCYICQAKPKEMNDIESILKKPCNTSTFQYGLSILHAHIRFFECILHISYRLGMKTWQIRGAENKAALEENKREIISKFRRDTGLLVDVVKQGSGNTNDGNTARRFFKNPKKTAEITKVDESLITQLAVILQTISCGYKINTEKFREYACQTAKLFVELYGWYKMPASVNKILIHGAAVMDTLLLPIGQLSEEALEARHKECRYFREHNTRKMGRKENIEDLLHALLISSDMIISNIRPLPKRKLNKLPNEVINLLDVPEITQQQDPGKSPQRQQETTNSSDSDSDF